MNKKNIKHQSNAPAQLQKTSNPRTSQKVGFYENANQWIKKRDWYFLAIGLLLAAIFGMLLFNPFINEAGDDTAYIERAYNFLYKGDFPSFQGPLYPMVLSLIVWICGVNVVVLKGFSLICVILSALFLFLALRKHVDALLNVFTLFMTCLSGAVLFYGGQTFNEAFYMLIQSLSIFVFARYYIDKSADSTRTQIVAALLMGLMAFLMSITKSIGIVLFPAILIVLLCFKQWKDALFNVCSFVFYYGVFAILKNLIWGVPFIEKGSQATILMQKNPYNAGDGMEDVAGYFSRLVENSNLYISQYFYQFTNIRPTIDIPEPIAFLTIITIAIWVVALWKSLKKKDKTSTFMALYAAFFMGASFIILQTFWKQDRLLLPIFPILLFLLFYGIVKLLDFRKRTAFAVLGLVCMLFLVFASGNDVIKKSEDRTAQKAYFKGNRVYAYTPDWKNYLLMSQWAADNTSDTCMIAARKSSMSNIFSGKFKFWGIYNVPTITYENIQPVGDTCLAMIMPIQSVNYFLPDLSQYLIVVIHTTDKFTLGESKDSLNLVGLYHIPKSKNLDLNQLRALNIPFLENPDDWIKQNCLKDGVSLYSPENLYQNLKTNNVRYVLMANIRMNPAAAGYGVLSTVNRYMYYISCKYPHFMGASIHTIGMTEQADLHPIFYE